MNSDIALQILNSENPYRVAAIQRAFPHISFDRFNALYNMNLESIDKYGVSFSPYRIYQTAALINTHTHLFPRFSHTDGLQPEYIASAYKFIVVLHNLHKITSRLISSINLDPLYADILRKNKDYHHSGYSLMQATSDDLLHMSANALYICESLNVIAEEHDYLTIIVDLLPTYSLNKQWLLFSHTTYAELSQYKDIPTFFIERIFKN